MPNWVRNTLTINAPSKEQAEAFIKEMSQPRPTPVYENYEWTGQLVTSEEEFSFWNLVAPPADSLDEYFGRKGVIDGKQVGDNPLNWYNWNLDNWGCKWDCSNVCIDQDNTEVTVMFSTPWGVPEGVVKAMAEKYPDLQIEWRFIEEQCWGGVYTLYAGHAEETQAWDIPSSHAEFVEYGIEDECVCAWSYEPEYAFPDCPQPVIESLPNLAEPTV